MAAQHLLSQGYARIACIAGPADVSTTEDRLHGFQEELARAGMPLPAQRLRRANLRPDGGMAAMLSLMDEREPPDAVFSTNGPLTVGTFRGIQELGLVVPDRIALLGVDDDHWTRMVTPRVTVLQQPVAEIGRLAGDLLLRRSRSQGTPPERPLLEPRLIVRESTTRSPR